MICARLSGPFRYDRLRADVRGVIQVVPRIRIQGTR
ncbi:hypothetical protein SAMN04490356_7644 [Streptomyces melanosporofaciens]|uniref:Uncharacterized protein n=1 Tax=Streptomyces melanosporofaciens TaxID=67327 RepID=A0A1H4Z7N1_STRMJ|nr:hypothetical protein SAMN04490356_7644 [Streptomyces melanosporofaciens]